MVVFHQPVVQECNMPFTTLTDEEEKELYRLQRLTPSKHPAGTVVGTPLRWLKRRGAR
jgi:hypothetical protein